MRLGMVAAEASGDLLAAHLLRALRARWPQLAAVGIGGPELEELGFQAWWPAEQLSVRGYLEVLPRLPALLRMRRQLVQRLLADPPDLFMGVDAPDFNFTVERRLREHGIRTVHFVSPSFWAWRPEKLQILRQSADHVLCLFPFEPELLAQAGVAASYVGHPLAQAIPMEPDQAGARAALRLPPEGAVVALLPGSRAAELRHLAPRFLRAARIVARARPGVSFVLPAVPWLRAAAEAEAQRAGAGQGSGPRLRVLSGQSHAALAACDVALVASGTATLEAALFKRPMVVAYAMPAFSHWLMRRRRQLPWVGLPNILCAPRSWLQPAPGQTPHQHADRADAPFVVPELLQQGATPEALAAAVLAWLDDAAKMTATRQRFVQLHQELLQPTSELAADAIQALLLQ